MGRHLQFAFFTIPSGDIIACDTASSDFWENTDREAFLSHLDCLRLGHVNTSTTIILDNTSYVMRIIPVHAMAKKGRNQMLTALNDGYIVLLQDQRCLSSVFHSLGSARLRSENFDDVFEDYETGIYITRADGISMFINSRYETITGIERKTAVGHSIYELNRAGMFMPLVTPVILETRREYTIFQSFPGGRTAIISGSPIYDAKGEPYCVLICVNQIEDGRLRELSRKMIAGSGSDNRPQISSYRHDQLDIIAENRVMRQTLQDTVKVAHYDVPVLLQGESGTGKEVLASIIHASSKRRFRSYVKINCSAITPSLLEAELFGYESGAFTGASAKGKPGLFETANDGTILLDEIGDMPLESQAKLLRVIQNGEVYRVGGLTPIRTTARIIAATNRDLEKMVRQGTFRKDLYYRLSVVPIYIQALRERREDIAPLLLHFSYVFNQKYGANKQFSKSLLDMLREYDWPGNIRELRNMVERMTIMYVDTLLLPSHYTKLWIRNDDAGDRDRDGPVAVTGIPLLEEAVRETERIVLTRALAEEPNTRRAAMRIGVSQSTLLRKMRECGVAPPKKNAAG